MTKPTDAQVLHQLLRDEEALAVAAIDQRDRAVFHERRARALKNAIKAIEATGATRKAL